MGNPALTAWGTIPNISRLLRKKCDLWGHSSVGRGATMHCRGLVDPSGSTKYPSESIQYRPYSPINMRAWLLRFPILSKDIRVHP